MGSVENKPASLLVVPLVKRRSARLSHLNVVDRWPATRKQARYSALIAFSRYKDKYATKKQKTTILVQEGDLFPHVIEMDIEHFCNINTQ